MAPVMATLYHATSVKTIYIDDLSSEPMLGDNDNTKYTTHDAYFMFSIVTVTIAFITIMAALIFRVLQDWPEIREQRQTKSALSVAWEKDQREKGKACNANDVKDGTLQAAREAADALDECRKAFREAHGMPDM